MRPHNTRTNHVDRICERRTINQHVAIDAKSFRKKQRRFGQFGGKDSPSFPHHFFQQYDQSQREFDRVDDLEWNGQNQVFQPALEFDDESGQTMEHTREQHEEDHDPEFQNFEDMHVTMSSIVENDGEGDDTDINVENLDSYFGDGDAEDIAAIDGDGDGDGVSDNDGDGDGDGTALSNEHYPLSVIEQYGLSPHFVQYFEQERHVNSLYQWQHDLLNLASVIEGRNLIYSLPTSGGKTLIAEILLLRTVLVSQKMAVLVLPYVSLVEEKKSALQLIGEEFDFLVEGYFSSQGMIPPMPGNVLCVATIEKANSLINSMIEEKRINELGCVVIDELHMIGDGERGSLLECLLTKLRYCQYYVQDMNLQLVGMSATIPNVQDLADWLEAELYVSDFRPVPLTEFLRSPDNKIFDKHRNEIRTLPSSRNGDRDNVVTLCTEVVPDASVLIFCSTKRNCEIVAKHVGRHLPEDFLQYDREFKIELMNDLKLVNPDIDEALLQSIPKGVAFHHSGLMSEERVLIEDAYRSRVLCVLTATSTLAAGVNLPAARVIFRTPYIARSFLEKGRYMQMCGRAGRAGIDDFGESYLMVTQHKGELERGFQLMTQPLSPITSALRVSVIHRLVLELVCSGLIKDMEDAYQFSQLSFYRQFTGEKGGTDQTQSIDQHQQQHQQQQQTKVVTVEDEFTRAFTSLLDNRLIMESKDAPQELDNLSAEIQDQADGNVDDLENTEDSHWDQWDESELEVFDSELLESQNVQKIAAYVPTPFGLATFKSAFSIDEAAFVSQELSKAQREGLILTDELHLCYLVTPVGTSLLDVNWDVLNNQMRTFDAHKKKIMNLIGLDEGLIFRKSMGGMTIHANDKDGERIAKRFYNALILCQLINEVPVHYVARRFGLKSRGSLQNLLQSAAMFSSMMVNFCRTMKWSFLEAILQCYAQRIGAGGVKTDLLELMEIDMVANARARYLYNAGFRTVKSVAECNPKALYAKLGKKLGPHPKTMAKMIVDSAQRLLRRKVAMLRKQAEQLEI